MESLTLSGKKASLPTRSVMLDPCPDGEISATAMGNRPTLPLIAAMTSKVPAVIPDLVVALNPSSFSTLRAMQSAALEGLCKLVDSYLLPDARISAGVDAQPKKNNEKTQIRNLAISLSMRINAAVYPMPQSSNFFACRG